MPVKLGNAQAVALGDKVYVSGDPAEQSKAAAARLYIYTPTADAWHLMDTPVYYFALTTYLSQLVLVGGVEDDYDEYQWYSCTNKLWVLNESTQDLQEKLPPMKTNRQFVCAVSYEMYLLVAGGENDVDLLDVVEVYNGYCWSYAQPLPFESFPDMKSVVHEGHWYLTCGCGQNKSVYFASLSNLIESSLATESSSIWNKFDFPDEQNTISSCLAVFQNQLIAVVHLGIPSPTVYTYSFNASTWLPAGDMPSEMNSISVLTLHTGELFVIGRMDSRFSTNKVLIMSYFRSKLLLI